MKNILLSSMFLVCSLSHSIDIEARLKVDLYKPLLERLKESLVETQLAKVNGLLGYRTANLNKPLLEQLHGLEGEERKEVIREWCGKFKRNLKTIKKESCSPGVLCPKAAPKINLLIQRYTKKYAKKINRLEDWQTIHDLNRIQDLNNKDTQEYIDALIMLQITRSTINCDLQNVSWLQWFQRWWNKEYQKSQELIEALDKEIALFEDQDKIVFDPEKPGNKNKKTKIQLTHREVFTRSHMPRRSFEEIKIARE